MKKNTSDLRKTHKNTWKNCFFDIKTNLPLKLKKPAPPYFDRYGKKMLYSTFQKNKATQWYVFFNVYQKDGEITFIIRYISNNHVTAQHL